MTEQKHTDDCLAYQDKMGLAFCGCDCGDEYVHEWHFFEDSADGMFCVKGCQGRLSREEAERRLNEYETLKKATERLKPAWVCEYCFACLLEGNLPDDWDLVFQPAVCPSCQEKVKQDGGYHKVFGGAYSDGRKDPRAYADILEGK